MRHADDDFLNVVIGREIGQLGKNRDGGFGAFEREPLLADETAVEEVFEFFGLEHVVENPDLFVSGEFERRIVALSMRCCNQSFSSGRWMYMYSQPILPQ